MDQGLITIESAKQISFHNPVFVVFIILIPYVLILSLLGIFLKFTFIGPGFSVKGKTAILLGYLYLGIFFILAYCFWILVLR